MTMLSLAVAGSGDVLEMEVDRLIVAGYTGRDESAVRAHIDELAAIGIAPPPRVPMRYDLDPGLLTTAPAITVHSGATSGEVEPVLLRHRGRWYLGVGSDHTDRDLERDDIGRSKAACPKPVGPVVLALPDGVVDGSYDRDWDMIGAESAVDGIAYQTGKLAALRTPSDLLEKLVVADADNVAIFAGTLPLLDGTFRYGREWSLALHAAGQTLSHHYRIS